MAQKYYSAWRRNKEPTRFQFSLRALLQLVLGAGFCMALIVQPESTYRIIGWFMLTGFILYVYFFYYDHFTRDS